MILPIYTFGAPVLREVTDEVEDSSEELQELIDDMFETMTNASGVGLAAPQIGRGERLFVVDVRAAFEDEEDEEIPVDASGPMVFINPVITPLDGPDVEFEEGCLSIPDLREPVVRPDVVEIAFLDRHMAPQRLQASGLLARVVQHEFDHLNGVLFVDHLSPLKRRLLKRRLREMAQGEVSADYPLVTAPEAERVK